MRDALFLPRIAGTLFAIFGAMGLMLAIGGLYGVTSYAVSRRTQEIGIRMALGAQTCAVQRLIVRDGMRVALIAVGDWGSDGAGCGAAGDEHSLRGEAGRCADLTLTPCVLLAVAFVACWIPSVRATRVDPMLVLRCDG